MPLASYQSTEAALSGLEAGLSDERNLVDLCLTFRRKRTGEELLRVGGRWDRRAKTYIDPDPSDLSAVAIEVNDNQVAVVLAFRRWLDARINGGPRVRLLVTGGNRRGGKSWIVTALAVATSVALPGAIVWLVSPTLEKRDELERYVREHAPQGWRQYKARELRFIFETGANIKNVTGDDAEALKRGEADLVVLNEPQQVASEVFTNAAPALIDNGGLMLLAGNPAQKRKGVWFTRLWKLVESGRYPHGEVHRLDRRDNPDVDQQAGKEIGELLEAVNPQAARADDRGEFIEPGSFAYAEHFDETRNTAPEFPQLAIPLTAQIIRSRGVVGPFDTLVGADFQHWPGNAGVQVEAIGDPKAPTWYVRRTLLREHDEDYFLDDACEIWERDRTLFIGDASGTWQDAAHVKGRTSFDKFRARKWRIEPPRTKRTDRGRFPANPSREDRINLVCRLLAEGRLIVCMDTAKDVAEDLQKCEVDSKGRPRGQHAHRTDALGYALWWATKRADERSSVIDPSKILDHAAPRLSPI